MAVKWRAIEMCLKVENMSSFSSSSSAHNDINAVSSVTKSVKECVKSQVCFLLVGSKQRLKSSSKHNLLIVARSSKKISKLWHRPPAKILDKNKFIHGSLSTAVVQAAKHIKARQISPKPLAKCKESDHKSRRKKTRSLRIRHNKRQMGRKGHEHHHESRDSLRPSHAS